MKVLSLKQPWATLIALGEKNIETRSWATKYRGKIAIHASKTIDKKVFQQYTFNRILKKHGITDISQIPTGVIVAIADLTEIIPTEELKINISRQEKILGIYKKGRFGWVLKNVKPINHIIAKGRLGVWDYNADEIKL